MHLRTKLDVIPGNTVTDPILMNKSLPPLNERVLQPTAAAGFVLLSMDDGQMLALPAATSSQEQSEFVVFADCEKFVELFLDRYSHNGLCADSGGICNSFSPRTLPPPPPIHQLEWVQEMQVKKDQLHTVTQYAQGGQIIGT
jgi:hypothetical protein